jgi:hypothetical protein
MAATLMIWAAVSCEMWVHFYQITRRHIPDESYLRNYSCFSFEMTQNTWIGRFRGFHQLLQFNDGVSVVFISYSSLMMVKSL